jgi:hypothetical protein
MTRRTIHGQVGRTLGKKLESKWVNIDGKRVQIEIRTQRKGEYDSNYLFRAVYDHGADSYEFATADTADEAERELLKLLKESLAIDWQRMLYIHVSHQGQENHGFNSQFIQCGHEVSISIGIIDVGECTNETLYRKVNFRSLRWDGEPGKYEFTPERHTSPSGPTPGHSEHFGQLDGDGLIPFTMEDFLKMLQVIEQLEKLGEGVRQMITGKDPAAIRTQLGNLALPAPEDTP